MYNVIWRPNQGRKDIRRLQQTNPQLKTGIPSMDILYGSPHGTQWKATAITWRNNLNQPPKQHWTGYLHQPSTSPLE